MLLMSFIDSIKCIVLFNLKLLFDSPNLSSCMFWLGQVHWFLQLQILQTSEFPRSIFFFSQFSSSSSSFEILPHKEPLAVMPYCAVKVHRLHIHAHWVCDQYPWKIVQVDIWPVFQSLIQGYWQLVNSYLVKSGFHAKFMWILYENDDYSL